MGWTFLKRLDVPEGMTDFNITAIDAAGNMNSTIITIVGDSTPPSIDVRLVPLVGELVDTGTGLYCTGPDLEVEINASEEIFVTVYGREMGPALNTTVGFELWEGPNDIFITVRDIAGNEGDPIDLLVILDTKTPTLKVLAPRSGAKTKAESVFIQGHTEPGIILSINDVRVPIHSGGTFLVEFPLETGPNEFHIVVADHAGHSNETTIIVTKEEPEGDLSVGFTSHWTVVLIGLSMAAVVGWAWSRRRGSRDDGDG